MIDKIEVYDYTEAKIERGKVVKEKECKLKRFSYLVEPSYTLFRIYERRVYKIYLDRWSLTTDTLAKYMLQYMEDELGTNDFVKKDIKVTKNIFVFLVSNDPTMRDIGITLFKKLIVLIQTKIKTKKYGNYKYSSKCKSILDTYLIDEETWVNNKGNHFYEY